METYVSYPWPSMIRTTYGDHERCRQDISLLIKINILPVMAAEEMKWILSNYGRVDDVINVSGHRIGTAEVEDAINTYEKVVESAVVGYPHRIKGQGIYALLSLMGKWKMKKSYKQLFLHR